MVEHRVPPGGQVFRQRPGLIITAGKVLDVHQTGADLGGFRIRRAGQFLGRSAVGTTLSGPLDAIGIDVAVVPNAAALS